MWSDVDENWERRKSYLIRSLFHDIPLLSPVPENDESRQTSRSSLPEPTRSVSPFRPESPLPPLVIEKMPNRHDDPPEFYRQLEKKIKKIYRKVFFDEEVGSEEDFPETYSDDIYFSLNAKETEYKEKSPESTVSSLPSEHNRSSYIIPRKEKTASHCTSQHKRTNKSSSSDDSNKNDSDLPEEEDDVRVSKAQSDSTSPSSVNGETQITDDSDKNNNNLQDKENPTAVSEVQSNGTSSNSVNGGTQIRGDSDKNNSDLPDKENPAAVSEVQSNGTSSSSVNGGTQKRGDSDKNNSDLPYKENPAAVSEVQSNGTSSSSVNGETQITVDVMVHEADNFEDVPESSKNLDECRSPILQLTSRSIFIHDAEREPYQDSEELSSHNNADSELGDEEVSRVASHNSHDTNVSTRSVELMRRQEVISPSWSLQDDQDETETSRHSDIIGFKRKTSFEIHAGEAPWIQNAAEDFTVSGEIAHDLLNVSTVLSPIPLSYCNRSSVESENVPAAARVDCEIPAVKRKKYEHLSVQTSTVEDNENMNWDYLKSNFFVGTPTIFKLCSCNDHKCETRQ